MMNWEDVEKVVASFKVMSQYLLQGNEESSEKSVGWPTFPSRLQDSSEYEAGVLVT
jgi:hypothetical protein